MLAFDVRPATSADVSLAAQDFPDLHPDRWREGGNRRSLVAVLDGVILGHARGIDNIFHPASRVAVLEVDESTERRVEVGRALLRELAAVSSLPLALKLSASMTFERSLARDLGGVAIQAMPPWRHVVTPDLRAWATAHRGDVQNYQAHPCSDVLDLQVRHYIAQHASWSPAADAATLHEKFAPEHTPHGTHPSSVVLRRDGRAAAAAIVGTDVIEPWGGREVTLVTERHDDDETRAELEACLAAVIDQCADGAVLLVDFHATERVEMLIARGLPQPPPSPTDGWVAIVEIPVGAGPEPRAMPQGLLPAEASWIEADYLPQS